MRPAAIRCTSAPTRARARRWSCPPAAARPESLFTGTFRNVTFGLANYDVSADGAFLMVADREATSPTRFTVVLNWLADLERRVP